MDDAQNDYYWAGTARAFGILEYEIPIKVLDNVRIMRSSFGAYAVISRGAEVSHARIGRYCSIGPGCLIAPSNHPMDRITTSPVTYGNQFEFFTTNQGMRRPFLEAHIPVEVGHDVWIGANAIIRDGIKIGTGAVIAAGAIVTHDVPAMTIVGGVPARKLGDRFPTTLAGRILDLRWWRYDLIAWHTSGVLPPAEAVDDAMLDAMQASIDAGTAPLIQGRRRRMTFGNGPPRLDQIPD